MSLISKTKKSVFAVTLLAAFAANGGYAAYDQVGDKGIQVSGKVPCLHSGEFIAVDVWSPQKDIGDLRAESDKSKYTDILVYREQYTTSDNGGYAFNFEMKDSDVNGFYKVVINCACGENVEEEIFYCNPVDNKKALQELSGKKTAKEVYDFCTGKDSSGNENKYRLGFIYDFETDMYSAELILDYIKSDEFDPEDKSGAITAYKKAVILSQINQGKISNIFDYDDVLGISKTRIKKFIENGAAIESIKQELTRRLKGVEIKTSKEYIDNLYEQFVLASVQNSNGYSDIGDIAEEFSAEIGISSRPSDKKCQEVMYKKYSSYDELAADLKATSGKKPTAGGSTFGGGSGNLGGNSFSDDFIKEEDKEKIDRNIFSDLNSVPWAIDAVVELAENGIINGKEPEKFYPTDTITREEAAKLITLAFLPEEAEANVFFDDVDNSSWYAHFVKVCCGCGVFKGINDKTFGTGQAVSREDMAVISYRTAVLCGLIDDEYVADEFVFDDDSNISDYAKEAVYILRDKKIINGVGDNMFEPKASLTRAEAAKIIYEIFTINK